MKPELLEPSLEALDALAGYEALCLVVTEDERPLSGAAGLLDWRLCGALSRLLRQGFFNGAPGERLLTPTDGRVPPGKLFAVGVGRTGAVTALGLEHALGQAVEMLKKAQVDSVVLALPRLPGLELATCADVVRRAFFQGFAGAHVGLFAEKPLRSKLDA